MKTHTQYHCRLEQLVSRTLLDNNFNNRVIVSLLFKQKKSIPWFQLLKRENLKLVSVLHIKLNVSLLIVGFRITVKFEVQPSEFPWTHLFGKLCDLCYQFLLSFGRSRWHGDLFGGRGSRCWCWGLGGCWARPWRSCSRKRVYYSGMDDWQCNNNTVSFSQEITQGLCVLSSEMTI